MTLYYINSTSGQNLSYNNTSAKKFFSHKRKQRVQNNHVLLKMQQL